MNEIKDIKALQVHGSNQTKMETTKASERVLCGFGVSGFDIAK